MCKISEQLILIDQASGNGSTDYIRSLPFGKKFYLECVEEIPYFDAKISEYIRQSGTKWWWHIENDSVFFNSNNFIGQAIDVLSSDPSVEFVHLRQIGPLDEILQPNVMFEVLASPRLKRTPAGTGYWHIDNRQPCSHWAIYTNHGWVARTGTALSLFEEIQLYGKDAPELQLSILCKSKEYGSAKLLNDAFWHWSRSGWWVAPVESSAVLNSLPERIEYMPSYELREHFYGLTPNKAMPSNGEFSARWQEVQELFLTHGLEEVYAFLGLM